MTNMSERKVNKMKTVRSGYLVFCRKEITNTRKGWTKITSYQDKIIGFCDTKRVSLELARSYINDDMAKYKDMKNYEFHEVTDDMISGYEFDGDGELDIYVKDDFYPYMIHKLSNAKNEVFVMYIVSKIKHRTM